MINVYPNQTLKKRKRKKKGAYKITDLVFGFVFFKE